MKMTAPVRLLAAALATAIALSAPRSTSADEGMWLLNNAPIERIESKYGIKLTPGFMLKMQRSALDFGGGSGSFISPDGLVLTNHHVGSDQIQNLSTKERNLMDDGFLARTREEELKAPGLRLRMLLEITDVTERINGAVQRGMTDAQAGAARRGAMSSIEKENSTPGSNIEAEVVTLYGGGLYHLYTFKVFTDVRLVFAPEKTIGFFGGDADNFEFPRFNLDMCLFRVYENGQPYKPEHHLTWSIDGSKEGDLALVFGHPGRTQRLYTMDHLRLERDFRLPMTLRRLWRSEIKFQTFSGRSKEHARVIEDNLFGVANGRKALTGQLDGLLDPRAMAAKQADEDRIRAQVNDNAEWRGKWGDAWDRIAESCAAFRDIATQQAAWRGRGILLDRALTLAALAEELPKPNEQRLREYRDAALPAVYAGLTADVPVYDIAEKHAVRQLITQAAEHVGGDDATVLAMLGGVGPAEAGERVIAETKLNSTAAVRALIDGGPQAIAASNDPLLVMARTIYARTRPLEERMLNEVEAVQRDNYAKIAAARFAIDGQSVYPDATGTLRLAFGPIRGLTDDGRTIPAYTTIAGTFERYNERKGEPGFELPESWLKNKDRLNGSTPFNFIAEIDIIGGNSGSPVVNSKGELIGLIFDGNIQSLPGAYYFDPAVNRSVAVDVRAMLEAMRVVYGADHLVKEITGK